MASRASGRTVLLLAVCLVFLVTGVLLEPLVGRASSLSFDNRLYPPLVTFVEGDEPARPMNLVGVDANAFCAPASIAAMERLRAGELPLWTERQLLGAPLFASLGAPVAYPTVLLHLTLGALRAPAASNALHLVLLGVGTLVYLARRGLAAPALLAGAASVSLSGFVSLQASRPGFIAALAYLPWIALTAERLLERPSAARVAALAACIGLAGLAGAPQIAACAVLAGVGLALVHARTSTAPRRFRACAAAAALGGFAGAAALLPAAEAHAASARAAAASETVSAPLAPAALAGFLLPHAFGHPVQEVSVARPAALPVEDFPTRARWLTDAHDDNLIDNALSFGSLAFLLAAVAAAEGRGRRDAVHLALFALAVATMVRLPLVSQAVLALPGVGVGSPKRLACLAVFAGAVLAARTVSGVARGRVGSRPLAIGGVVALAIASVAAFPFEDWLARGAAPELAAWTRDVIETDLVRLGIGGLVLCAAAWLVAHRRARRAAWLLATAVALEGLTGFRVENPPQPLEHQYESTAAVQWLRERGAGARVVSFSHDVLPGPLAVATGFSSVNGFHPLVDARLLDLVRALDPTMVAAGGRSIAAVRDVHALRSPLLDLFGARFVATHAGGAARIEAELPELERVYTSEREGLAIYERPGAVPLAFLVPRVEVEPDTARRVARLASVDFRPAGVALVETPLSLASPGARLGGGTVELTRPHPELIELEVDCEAPGFLVVVETASPGWRATVDGESVELLRADHAFLGVEVPAGRHTVELRYRPHGVAAGAALSFASAAAIIGLLAVGLASRRAGGDA